MAKRGRKPKVDRKGYFYETEEEAFVKYLETDDVNEKREIFKTYLYKPFTKMIEAIIHRYKLYPPNETFDEVFNDTMSFLMTKIEKFNVNSGYKAYSYCGTICKNYLIFKVNQSLKNQERNASYDTLAYSIDNDINFSKDAHSDSIHLLNEIIQETANKIEVMMSEKTKYKLKENELKVGQALVSLLRNFEELFIKLGSHKFNKSAILMFLKETTLLSTQEIRNSMKKYKSAYQEIKDRIYDEND